MPIHDDYIVLHFVHLKMRFPTTTTSKNVDEKRRERWVENYLQMLWIKLKLEPLSDRQLPNTPGRVCLPLAHLDDTRGIAWPIWLWAYYDLTMIWLWTNCDIHRIPALLCGRSAVLLVTIDRLPYCPLCKFASLAFRFARQLWLTNWVFLTHKINTM